MAKPLVPDPLVVPKTEPRDWLFPVIAGVLNPKMSLPVLPIAAEELPNMPIPVPLLFSSGSEPEDDTGKLVGAEGVDPNLKNEVVGDEDETWVEELLLLAATTAGVLVVMPMLVEATYALTLLLLAARDELLNIF